MLRNDTNIGDPSNTLLDSSTSKYRIWLSAYNVGQQPGFISFCAFGQAIATTPCQYFDMTNMVIKAGKLNIMVEYVDVDSTTEPTANGNYVAVCAEAQRLAWSNEQPGEWNDCDTKIQQNKKGDYFVTIDFKDLE